MKEYNPNKVARFLDWLCGLDKAGSNHFAGYYLMVFCICMFFGFTFPILYLIFYYWITGNNDEDPWKVWNSVCIQICDHSIFFWWILYIMPIIFIRVDLIYRYFRNRYLRKHNIIGPYGMCSIDQSSYYRFLI